MKFYNSILNYTAQFLFGLLECTFSSALSMEVRKGMNAFVLLISISHDLHLKDNNLSYCVVTDFKQSIEE